MSKNHSFRVFWAAAGFSVLLFALGRCSPVAPSVYKNTLTTHADSKPSGTDSGNELVHLLLYKNKVVLMAGGGSIQEVLGLQPSPRALLTLSNTDQTDRLVEFQKTGGTEIGLSGATPAQGAAYIEIALPQSQKLSYELSSFDTTVKPNEDGTWSLAVSPSTPANVASFVLNHLVSVTLVFNGQKEAASDSAALMAPKAGDSSQSETQAMPDASPSAAPSSGPSPGPSQSPR